MRETDEINKSRIFKNSIYSSLSWLFPLALSFIVTPIVIKRLGNESYGLYTIILGFIGSSFAFGIGKTAAKYVSEFRTLGETEKISEALSVIFWFSLAIGLLGAGIPALAAGTIVNDVLQIEPHLRETAKTAIYLGCVTILVTILSQIFQYVLQGLHRFDRFVLYTSLNGFLLNLGSVAIVLMGYGVIELLDWNLFVIFGVGVFFCLSARKLLPEFTFRIRIRKDLRNSVLKYGGNIILFQVFSNLLLLFERGWIVRRFGTEALTFYAVPMSIAMYPHTFIGSLVIVLFPVFNELLKEKDREQLIQLYKRSSKVVIALIGFLVITAVAGGRQFLAIWISSEFADNSYNLLIIHLLTFGLLANLWIIWQINESFGSSKLNAISSLIWMSTSIPLMVLLSNFWQTQGVGLARLVGLCFTLPIFLYAEIRFLGGVFWTFWLSVLLRILVAGALLFFVQWEIFANLPPGWFTLILGFMIGGIVFWTILAIIGFLTKQEWAIFRQMVLKRP